MFGIILIAIIVIVCIVKAKKNESKEIPISEMTYDDVCKDVRSRKYIKEAIDYLVNEINDDKFEMIDWLREDNTRYFWVGAGINGISIRTHNPSSNVEDNFLYSYFFNDSRVNRNYPEFPKEPKEISEYYINAAVEYTQEVISKSCFDLKFVNNKFYPR